MAISRGGEGAVGIRRGLGAVNLAGQVLLCCGAARRLGTEDEDPFFLRKSKKTKILCNINNRERKPWSLALLLGPAPMSGKTSSKSIAGSHSHKRVGISNGMWSKLGCRKGPTVEPGRKCFPYIRPEGKPVESGIVCS